MLDGKLEKFMIMEIKRPGTLGLQDWTPALRGGAVQGDGEKFCRQGVKYAYSFGVPFLIFCDGTSMVFIFLRSSFFAMEHLWCSYFSTETATIGTTHRDKLIPSLHMVLGSTHTIRNEVYLFLLNMH